jgi:hypothetical protein
MNIMALTDSKGGGLDRFLTESCGSLRFQRFSLGCRKRMGQDWRPNRAISDPIMLKLLALTELKSGSQLIQPSVCPLSWLERSSVFVTLSR